MTAAWAGSAGSSPRTNSGYGTDSGQSTPSAAAWWRRRASERVLGGAWVRRIPVPASVRAALPALPKAMSAGGNRAGRVERGVVDLVEAAVLSGREGERFDAVVIDDGLVQLRAPAVRGRLEDGGPPPGQAVTVRLEKADVATRTVAFAAA